MMLGKKIVLQNLRRHLLVGFVIGAGMVGSPLQIAAHEFETGDLTIIHPWTPPTSAANAPIFMTIENAGAAVNIVAAEVGGAARSGLMEAVGQRADGLNIAADGQISLQPGVKHVMAIGLAAPLSTGQTVPIKLTLNDGTVVEVTANVEAAPSHD